MTWKATIRSGASAWDGDARGRADGRVGAGERDWRLRALALAGGLVLIVAFLWEFLSLTVQFGGTRWLLAYVGLAFAAATLAARYLPTEGGLIAGGLIFGIGTVGYLALIPDPYYALITVGNVLDDLIAWLTGRSVVLMLEVDLWAIAVAPAPVFLTWYLALQGRYDAAALVGGAMLGFFVLTGDASEATTLVGMVGLFGLLGFGGIETADIDREHLQELGLVLGVAVVIASFIRLVPSTSADHGGGSGAGGAGESGGDGDGPTLEQNLLENPDELHVTGSVDLEPVPRFRVASEVPAYWQTRSFDTYTGDGWRRTGRAASINPLQPPPGGTKQVEQRFVAEGTMASTPFAWKPLLLGTTAAEIAEVTSTGELEPTRALEPGEEYELLSAVSDWSESDLRDAGEDYPSTIRRRYTDIPEDVPERLTEKTGEIVEGASTPYEKALAIQQWLEGNKSYSLDVSRPSWDLADAFVFSMTEGYCTYFATAMTVMLRTQGVPARFVVGYSTGERFRGDEWLVRGLNSHAWVQVYFPGVGWIAFDPTPAGPRSQARDVRLEEADPETTEPSEPADPETPTETPTETPADTDDGFDDSTPSNDTEQPPGAGAVDTPDPVGRGVTDGSTDPEPVDPGVVGSTVGDTPPTPDDDAIPGRDRLRGDRLWLLGAVATLAFGSVRMGVAQSAYRKLWLRWQPRTDSPETDLQRAVDRLEHHLGSRARERADGETWNQYLGSLVGDDPGVVDERVERVVELHYRSRYGEDTSREDADEAIDLVDDLVRSG